MGNASAERSGLAVFFVGVQRVVVTGDAGEMDNIRLGDSPPLAGVYVTDIELFKCKTAWLISHMFSYMLCRLRSLRAFSNRIFWRTSGFISSVSKSRSQRSG